MLQRAITVPLPGPRGNAKEYLETYGFKPPKPGNQQILQAIRYCVLAIVVVLMIGLGVAWLSRTLGLGTVTVDMANVILVGIALVTLIVGYQQWIDARREVSLDKYYERLDLANQRQDGKHTKVHQMMRPCLPELAGESHEVLMYVYVELDNLEYVIEKYKLGYMTEKHACRGLKTFQLRCWSEQFRRIAQHRVRVGDYRHRTAVVVDRVCDKIEELTERQYQRAAEGADRRHVVRRTTDLRLVADNQNQKGAEVSGPTQPKDGHAPGLPAQENQAAQS